MYLKISNNSYNNSYSSEFISLNLKADEEIADIQVIDANRLLITIKNNTFITGAIYNIKMKKIQEYIDK